MSHVILLRESTEDGNKKDPYEAALKPMSSSSVPVYETVQTLDELMWILETGPKFHGLKGVIATSKRSVEAWAAAAKQSQPMNARAGRESWQDVPFYVVGNATGAAVKSLSIELSNIPELVPKEVLGEETGTGEQLAHFILRRLAEQRELDAASQSPLGPPSPSPTVSTFASSIKSKVSQASLRVAGTVTSDPLSRKRSASSVKTPKTKLLFLTGDKTKDALPTILGADPHVELDPVQVYETRPSPSLAMSLMGVVLSDPVAKDWWVAVFAPSGIDNALPHLQEQLDLPLISSDSGSKSTTKGRRNTIARRARIAAIGPTTAAHLRDNLKLEVTVVASKPNPDELAKAIRAAAALR